MGGSDRLSKLDVIIAGDDVTKKKPDPMIYNKARERLGLMSEQCVVIEDSLVGLRAAKAANMRCIITYTASTENEEFYAEGADAKIPNLSGVELDGIFSPMEKDLGAELLPTLRDPIPLINKKG